MSPAGNVLLIVVAGVALGLSLAVPPGPVNAIIAVQSSSKSAKRGFLVGLGAMTADSVFLVITYFVGQFIAFNGPVRIAFYAVSCVLMLFLAYVTYRSLHSVGSILNKDEGAKGKGGMLGRKTANLPYFTGLTMGLTNPMQITWWLSVGLSLIASIGLAIIVGFFAGILIWISSFSIVMHWASKKIPSLYKWVVYASTLLLFAFAAWFLYSLLILLRV